MRATRWSMPGRSGGMRIGVRVIAVSTVGSPRMGSGCAGGVGFARVRCVRGGWRGVVGSGAGGASGCEPSSAGVNPATCSW